jgi:hypothetical protein
LRLGTGLHNLQSVPTQSTPPASSPGSALTSDRPLRISKRLRKALRGVVGVNLKDFARFNASYATAEERSTSPAALDRKGELRLAALAWHWLVERGIERTVGKREVAS